jgi:hypothetical protein
MMGKRKQIWENWNWKEGLATVERGKTLEAWALTKKGTHHENQEEECDEGD